jgi:glucose/arabinose dehydrogenase
MIPWSWPKSAILFLIVVLIDFGLDPQSVAEARSAPLPKAAPASTLPSGAPLDSSKLTFQLVTAGLTQPVFITYAPDGSNRLFIVQQSGQIRIFKNGALLSTPFLNIVGTVPAFTGTNSEQGLLGLAFDPQYSVNGFFYITYTTHNSDPTFLYTTTLARYHVSASPDLADVASGSVLLAIPKKYTNHNGGMLAFGPDGFLYMSMGDGGSGRPEIRHTFQQPVLRKQRSRTAAGDLGLRPAQSLAVLVRSCHR